MHWLRMERKRLTTVNESNPRPHSGVLDSITLVAATPMEARALHRTLPSAHVVTAGIALARGAKELRPCVISCGVAGALRDDLSTGTVVVPAEIGLADGRRIACDPELVATLVTGARNLGIEPVTDSMLTADTLVTGAQRPIWAARGFAAVDMETGRIAAPRVAAVRVILDTPARELSRDWERPILALLKPWNWPQAFWLAREAPRAAELAARVVAQGILCSLRITKK